MDDSKSYEKIKGWLWLPAIALMVQPVSFVIKGILPFFKYYGPHIRLEVSVPMLIGDIVLLIMVAIVAWFYFNRKKIAPALYVAKILIMVLMWEIMDGLIDSQHDPPYMGMLVHSLVILPYLVLSKTVERTFTVELNSKVRIERIFIRPAPFLMKYYLKLRKMRWLVFVFVILFLCFSVLIYAII
jgi:hypothetical protein